MRTSASPWPKRRKSRTKSMTLPSASTADLAKGTDLAIDQARVALLDRQIAEMKTRNADLEQDYTQLAERRKALVLQ